MLMNRTSRHFGGTLWSGMSEGQWWAQGQVQKAVRAGQLARPAACECCGQTNRPPVGHHHNGYGPGDVLDVVWLCHSCHGNEHIGPAIRALNKARREAWEARVRRSA